MDPFPILLKIHQLFAAVGNRKSHRPSKNGNLLSHILSDPTLYVRVSVLPESPYPDLHIAPLFLRRKLSLLKLGFGAHACLHVNCSGAGMDVSFDSDTAFMLEGRFRRVP